MAKGQQKQAGSGTKIRKCGCTIGGVSGKPDAATYQDAKYGVGIRVHNLTGKGLKCTVCGTTQVA